jgi:hypothetical protein
LQNLILIDVLFSAWCEKEKEREKKKKNQREKESVRGREGGFPGADLPCWLCHKLQLLDAIKGLFKG